jgi:hypothetical protein
MELDVGEIRNELGRQGGLLRALVYAQAGHLGDLVLEAMESDPVLARIYLLLSKPMSQTEVVDALKLTGVPGASQSSISRKMEKLEKELGVIAPIGAGGRATKFTRNEAAIALKIDSRIKRHKDLKKLI